MPWQSSIPRARDVARRRACRLVLAFASRSGVRLSCVVRVAVGLLIGAVIIGVTGCGASSVRPAARTAASTSAGSTPPVTVSVSVVQLGAVAEHNVKLIATITVSNHTSQAIKVVVPYCNTPNPPVLVEVDDAAGSAVWQTHLWDGPCPFMPPRDAEGIGPSASITWVVANDLSKPSMFVGVPPGGSLHLQAGARYLVRVTLLEWHQGSLKDLGTPSVPQGIDVVGTTSVVLR